MIKNYLPIGSARLLDVRVIMDDQVIYDGLVDKAPDDIKQLKYYDISFDGNKVEYKVTNEQLNIKEIHKNIIRKKTNKLPFSYQIEKQ